MTSRPETPTDRMRARRINDEAAEDERAKRETYLDALHFEVLGSTPRGRELMAHIRKHTIERRTNPETPDGALRGLEHTRNFVHDIEGRIARYRERGTETKG